MNTDPGRADAIILALAERVRAQSEILSMAASRIAHSRKDDMEVTLKTDSRNLREDIARFAEIVCPQHVPQMVNTGAQMPQMPVDSTRSELRDVVLSAFEAVGVFETDVQHMASADDAGDIFLMSGRRVSRLAAKALREKIGNELAAQFSGEIDGLKESLRAMGEAGTQVVSELNLEIDALKAKNRKRPVNKKVKK